MREIEQKFNEELLALDLNDLAFEARKYSINIKRAENTNKVWKSLIFLHHVNSIEHNIKQNIYLAWR